MYCVTDHKGRRHLYRWVNGVQLNGGKDADYVNFFEYRLQTKGKQTYYNSWVTDIRVEQANVVD